MQTEGICVGKFEECVGIKVEGHLELQANHHRFHGRKADRDGRCDWHVLVTPRLVADKIIDLIRVGGDGRLLVHKWVPAYPAD